jgi:hypothetical protein
MRLTDAVARVVRRLGAGGADVARLDDDELLELLSDTTEARKALELVVACASAEVSRRSTRDLGYGGLAQRKGLRTGTALVQQITGLGRTDVTRAVQTGEELAPTVPASAAPPAPGTDAPGTDASSTDAGDSPVSAAPEWLRLLREALTSGALSQAQFHAIRTGLGEPPVDRYPQLDSDFLSQACRRRRAIRGNAADLRDLPARPAGWNARKHGCHRRSLLAGVAGAVRPRGRRPAASAGGCSGDRDRARRLDVGAGARREAGHRHRHHRAA